MSDIRPIPYGRQFISEEDIQAVVETLKSDYLTQGPKIGEFEEKFAEYVGAKYAVAVSNGTAALHLSALSMDIKEGQKVITTPITFAASANCIVYAGGEVDFADIDPETYLIDIEKVEEKLANEPKGSYCGIIPVDFAGRAVNLEKLKNLADEYGLWIIEDAAHSPGGYFVSDEGEQKLCGSCEFTECAIFSFHPVKHIAAGEGGMITTNDLAVYNKLIMLRSHGITKSPELLNENHGGWYYEMQELGFNYRLTDIQAALGVSQLKRANQGLENRRAIAAKYQKELQDIPQIIRQSGVVGGHAYHLYVIEVEDRLGLYNYLRENNVFTQIHYIPIHLMPFYKKKNWNKGDFPEAERYYDHCISLPMYHTLTQDQQNRVIDLIKDYYNK